MAHVSHDYYTLNIYVSKTNGAQLFFEHRLSRTPRDTSFSRVTLVSKNAAR